MRIAKTYIGIVKKYSDVLSVSLKLLKIARYHKEIKIFLMLGKKKLQSSNEIDNLLSPCMGEIANFKYKILKNFV